MENDEEAHKFTLGQNLWAELGRYCDPSELLDDDIIALTQETVYCMTWKMPPYANLKEADALKLRYMTIINEELTAAHIRKAKRDGN